MEVFAFSQALGQTLALIATFGGIGLIANLLIFYIIAQVLAERRENREYREQREA
jgi:phage shock protein PspC (stress-responsive transcriptional regulator)